MALKDRRAARNGALSAEDRELQAHLKDAKVALEKALSVCRKVSNEKADFRAGAGISPKEAAASAEALQRAGRARQNLALITGIIGQMERVTDFKSKLAQDFDLLPEPVKAAISREERLDRRVKRDAKRRDKATEMAVRNVLSSLTSKT